MGSNPSDPSQNVSVNMCLVKDYGTKDPFNYFGGMYSTGRNPTNNYFTNKKSCPDGFKDYIFMGCDAEFSDLCIEPHICYNASVHLKDSIIGGFTQKQQMLKIVKTAKQIIHIQ